MCEKCIVCIIIFCVQIVAGDYECVTSEHQTSCTDMQANDLYENLTVTLTNDESDELQVLQIQDSTISVVNSEMFVHFPNIETLRLRNTSTQKVEQGAFGDLLSLQKVYLTDNYLQEFDSSVFSSNNSLVILDLSHNLLHNLDKFDVYSLPLLRILNISHNRLEYLPENFLKKINEKNNIYLIVDNNPWNCLHSQWVQNLSELLIEAFCNNKIYDPVEMESKMETLNKIIYNDSAKNETDSDNTDCSRYSLRGCLTWAFGAMWVGIIIGNMCKLKRLLFTTPRRYEDKNTQCDVSWKEPFIREDLSKADSQDIKGNKSDINKII